MKDNTRTCSMCKYWEIKAIHYGKCTYKTPIWVLCGAGMIFGDDQQATFCDCFEKKEIKNV